MQMTLSPEIDIRPPDDDLCRRIRLAAIHTPGRTERNALAFLERERLAMEAGGYMYWACGDTLLTRRLGTDAPEVLLVQGIPDMTAPRVAIIGPRRPDDYGLEMAAFFAGALGRRGVTVVSGGAAGIDTAAHKACLEAGGRTICVLGTGFDRPFPPQNREFFRSLGRDGPFRESCLISEYSPDLGGSPHHFPERNRLVAAMSDAVIVIQAEFGSGTMITARLAIDIGVPVFAVPADIYWNGSAATNDLLGRGAMAICRPGDLECVPDLSGCSLALENRPHSPRPHGNRSPWPHSVID